MLRGRVLLVGLIGVLVTGTAVSSRQGAGPGQAPALLFDHTHTHAEVVAYLQSATKAYPEITKLETVGKSYLGKDLLVLEITNHKTGPGLEKPGYWIDGNLHSGEVFGGEVCLHTIITRLTGYGRDPAITAIVDNYTFYVMPKVNPDGSDHYITKPDGMRSTVRPFDEDGDGRLDEDPPEDLNGDGYITMMRVADPNGPMRTSPEDPRLMVPRTQGVEKEKWAGQWRVYQEGIDNDNDGVFNEDGVGGIDINRNFPEQWQPHPFSVNPGLYPLSEAESRALADAMLARPNLTGSINYHMTGNVAVFPPSAVRNDPITGDIVQPQPDDQAAYRRLGAKMIELSDTTKVQVFKIQGQSPVAGGQIWGTVVDWAYYRLGIHSWIFEFGINPGVTELFPSSGKEIDRLRWSDKNIGGKLFADWKSFNHPQLGTVEIGGLLGKIYDPTYKTYTNIQVLPGPEYEKRLTAHTNWHLFLISQAPLVRVENVKAVPGDPGYFTVTADVRNIGSLPTYVTEQAVLSGLAKTVKASVTLEGASLVHGAAQLDLGHLKGNGSREASAGKVSWLVKVSGTGKPKATIRAVSEKGGTDSKQLDLVR